MQQIVAGEQQHDHGVAHQQAEGQKQRQGGQGPLRQRTRHRVPEGEDGQIDQQQHQAAGIGAEGLGRQQGPQAAGQALHRVGRQTDRVDRGDDDGRDRDDRVLAAASSGARRRQLRTTRPGQAERSG